MRQTVFPAAANCICVLGVSAEQHNIDTQKSTLTIHVGKTGVFSALGHEHEVRALIHIGTAGTGAHPAVEVHAHARELRVIGKDLTLIRGFRTGEILRAKDLSPSMKYRPKE
jgi:hypothetical protein